MEQKVIGRLDYNGKGWLQKNAGHAGKLAIIVFVFLVYFLLPLIGKTPPDIPELAWITLAAAVGIRDYFSGKADVEVNKRLVTQTSPASTP